MLQRVFSVMIVVAALVASSVSAWAAVDKPPTTTIRPK
jgi:hypothetical protein